MALERCFSNSTASRARSACAIAPCAPRCRRTPRPIRPIPGRLAPRPRALITGVFAELNQAVERGTKLLAMEAMKMQSTIYAPVAGRITKILVAPGQNVDAKDLLVAIAP